MDQSNNQTRDARYAASLGYSISMMGNDSVQEIYNRSSTSQLQQVRSNSENSSSLPSDTVNMIPPQSSDNSTNNSIIGAVQQQQQQRGIKRASTDLCYETSSSETRQQSAQSLNLVGDCGPDNSDETFTNLGLSKKSPPSNGKKTKGRVKIKMEYIDNKLRRYTTFSKRKTGIMKKAYELSTLTGTQVMLLVASETGHVYTFATRKLQPMITSEAGKALIQTCLNSPDPPPSGSSGDQRMSATGFEETELTYNITDDEQKVRQLVYSSHGTSLHGGYTPTSSQQNAHVTPTHAQHSHLLHTHVTPSSTHLAPCSSPNSMLSNSPYVQSCPSPLPPHASYHPHMTHSHTQR